jgi:hypothetical protein
MVDRQPLGELGAGLSNPRDGLVAILGRAQPDAGLGAYCLEHGVWTTIPVGQWCKLPDQIVRSIRWHTRGWETRMHLENRWLRRFSYAMQAAEAEDPSTVTSGKG